MSDPNSEASVLVAQEMTSWKSLEVSVREQLKLFAPIGPQGSTPFDRLEYHYIETHDGNRVLDSRAFAEGRIVRTSAYCDGRRCARVEYASGHTEQQSRIIISENFMSEGTSGTTDRPIPFQYFYVGKIPLYEALIGSKYMGPGEALGRPCGKFMFANVEWGRLAQNLLYTLDKATGIPLRVDSFDDSNAPREATPLWSWEAKSLSRKDGHLVVIDSSLVEFGSNKSPLQGQEVLRREVQVESIFYDKDFPRSSFWPITEPSADVFDAIAKKIHHASVPQPTATASAGLIDATPPSDWTVSFSHVAFVIGSIALLAGLVILVRRLKR